MTAITSYFRPVMDITSYRQMETTITSYWQTVTAVAWYWQMITAITLGSIWRPVLPCIATWWRPFTWYWQMMTAITYWRLMTAITSHCHWCRRLPPTATDAGHYLVLTDDDGLNGLHDVDAAGPALGADNPICAGQVHVPEQEHNAVTTNKGSVYKPWCAVSMYICITKWWSPLANYILGNWLTIMWFSFCETLANT